MYKYNKGNRKSSGRGIENKYTDKDFIIHLKDTIIHYNNNK